jgi:hypothetical protein
MRIEKRIIVWVLVGYGKWEVVLHCLVCACFMFKCD